MSSASRSDDDAQRVLERHALENVRGLVTQLEPGLAAAEGAARMDAQWTKLKGAAVRACAPS
jgi:hypothetical protein